MASSDFTLVSALPEGYKLDKGRYTLKKPLGQGLLGITYSGWDEKLNRAVIVKEFFPPGASREGAKVCFPDSEAYHQMKRKFVEEMRIISPIKQKSIIEVYDIVEEEAGTYAILEPMKGKPMSEVVAKKSLPGEAALYYFWDLLKVLDVLHKKGILHRHILPYHIYLEEWRAILTEFGAARFFVAQKTRRLTQYLSPGFSPVEEYYADSTATPITYAADFYGLGASFYYALTQKIPTDAPTRLMKNEKLPHLRELRRDISLALADCVMWCLELYPENRPQSAAAIMQKLPPPPSKPSLV